jgi:GTP cyclohydrolase I
MRKREVKSHAQARYRTALWNILTAAGENPMRSGLKETPQRVVRAMEEMLSGYKMDPMKVLKAFDDGAEGVKDMVFQGSIPLWSMCEHHMLPFFGVAHIGYLPKGKILGLSKFARVVDVFAKRLQVQERLGRQIADALEEYLDPVGLGVVLQCRHSCMEARGVRRQGSVTVTQVMRRDFMHLPGPRDEFLSMVRTASEAHW